MKKIIALIAFVIMMSFVSTTVFAATSTGGTTEIEVKGKYVDSVTNLEVISVDITWGAMEFSYNISGSKEWNPANHTYEDNSASSWTHEGNTITVVNHSNVSVKADFAFTATDTNVTGTFDVSTKTLAAGVVGEYDNADKVVASLTLSGSVDKSKTNFAKVGSITVTIARGV